MKIHKQLVHTNLVDWIYIPVPVLRAVLTLLNKTDKINQSKLELIDWHHILTIVPLDYTVIRSESVNFSYIG